MKKIYSLLFVLICCSILSVSGKSVVGTIKYSDGTPAAGVMVSDGFRVVLSDEKGGYRIGDVTDDTWYIYLSYPADAKVTYNALGMPDFYRRYDPGRKRYDFTLEKQSVEGQFRIIAVGDMHGCLHPKIRGLQHIEKEMIPGINNVYNAVNDLPCYIISLGDIIHNWWNWNSNNDGSFEKMREFTSRSHMPAPVFHTIGNHDFTWYTPDSLLTADALSSTVDLKWQRRFEETFGPVNYSFTRGKVHFVCMKNTLPVQEGGITQLNGFSDAQYEWLKQDLSHVEKGSKVIFCVHQPFMAGEKFNRKNVIELLKSYDCEIFNAHEHYTRYFVFEGIPSHVVTPPGAGAWCTDNIAADGTPKSVRVFTFNDNRITSDVMYTLDGCCDKQMRVCKGGLKYGGKYALFQTMDADNELLINVFNAKPGWTIDVYEDGVKTGSAELMDYNRKAKFNCVEAGQTYTVPAGMSQDWWALGYIKGNRGHSTSNSTYFGGQNRHMYHYVLKTPNPSITVMATDPFGAQYSCSEVITDGTTYPESLADGQ